MMRNKKGRTQNNQLSRETIEQILQEEDQYFVNCHHRSPVGRESEDVVDNAYARILRIKDLPYLAVSDIYSEMRCAHAGR